MGWGHGCNAVEIQYLRHAGESSDRHGYLVFMFDLVMFADEHAHMEALETHSLV